MDDWQKEYMADLAKEADSKKKLPRTKRYMWNRDGAQKDGLVWSIDEKNYIAAQVSRGHSYSEIAMDLGVSRNAIAGLVFRMKEGGEL